MSNYVHQGHHSLSFYGTKFFEDRRNDAMAGKRIKLARTKNRKRDFLRRMMEEVDLPRKRFKKSRPIVGRSQRIDCSPYRIYYRRKGNLINALIFLNNRSIGYCVLRNAENGLDVEEIVVSSKYRRNGVMKTLLGTMISVCENIWKFSTIEIYVSSLAYATIRLSVYLANCYSCYKVRMTCNHEEFVNSGITHIPKNMCAVVFIKNEERNDDVKEWYENLGFVEGSDYYIINPHFIML